MVRRARMPVATESLSASEARALALHAQGLGGPRVGPVDLPALASRLGAIQIDSVNVLVRSHYLPAFSRLGAYPLSSLDSLSYSAPRELFEYWGHEASLLPVSQWPLWQWRMAEGHRWQGVKRMGRRKAFLASVLDQIRARGPLGAGDLEGGTKRPKSGWWEWSDAKRAVEHLFWNGDVTVSGRRGFERLYDLPSRVLPPSILAAPTPEPLDARAALVEIAARALGVATLSDLRAYFHLSAEVAREAVPRLVDSGALLPVQVEGWDQPAFRHASAVATPIDPTRASLLSPFDSLIWYRERTERLFGVRIRLEIYTPAPKRIHGYYVLPLLLGDRIVARVDLKSDRAESTLRVQAAHVEPGSPPKPVAAALAAELSRMSSWLSLSRIAISGTGNLAARLKTASNP
ncbi:MAG TPA: crosslink repair DNA glycosylase YcaQ family protein [Kofleriaceae bacterium]